MYQGKSIDINGYYLPNDELVSKQMRASATFKFYTWSVILTENL